MGIENDLKSFVCAAGLYAVCGAATDDAMEFATSAMAEVAIASTAVVLGKCAERLGWLVLPERFDLAMIPIGVVTTLTSARALSDGYAAPIMATAAKISDWLPDDISSGLSRRFVWAAGGLQMATSLFSRSR